jgi:hypothetical protein
MAQDIVLAMPSEHLISLVTTQSSGALIPVMNTPLSVHKVHTIAHMVQQLFIKGWVARRVVSMKHGD